jgi:tetratricopeptide (TPR) repeat protein
LLRQLAPPGSQAAADYLRASLDNYTRAAELFPSGPTIPMEMARVYDDVGDREHAIEKYQLAKDLDFNQYTGPAKHLTQAQRDAISQRIIALQNQQPS